VQIDYNEYYLRYGVIVMYMHIIIIIVYNASAWGIVQPVKSVYLNVK